MFAGGAFGENLLANPGFDGVDVQGAPEQWDLFVMPMEGARGELDSSTISPPFSVKLHNPAVYPEEPANNWSQTIIGDLAGETLRVSGMIKTEDATEAALWLQCWSRNPPRVLAVYSTSTDTPVYGTRDWTPVSMRAEVPERTDFLVLRCVLKGQGTAWFDVLSVEPAVTELPEAPAAPAAPGEVGKTLRELLEANASLSATLSAMTESNRSLLAQIGALQEELASLREDIGATAERTTVVIPPGEAAAPGQPALSQPAPGETAAASNVPVIQPRTDVTVTVPSQPGAQAPVRDPREPRGQIPEAPAPAEPGEQPVARPEPPREYGPHPLVPVDWPEDEEETPR